MRAKNGDADAFAMLAAEAFGQLVPNGIADPPKQ